VPDATEEKPVTYTYYDYLELAPGASEARIEAAYAQLLERFGYGTTEAGQDMSGLVRMIHAAYRVLTDPMERTRYDAQLARDAALADAELKATLDQQAGWIPRLVQDVPAPLLRVVGGAAA
jgi:DnaJ-class molecular chaperone